MALDTRGDGSRTRRRDDGSLVSRASTTWEDPGAQEPSFWDVLGLGYATSPFGQMMNAKPPTVRAVPTGSGTSGGSFVNQPQPQGNDYWLRAYDQFIEEMRKPLDMNDPVVKQTMVDVQNFMARTAQERGIQGGLATGASEGALQKSLLTMSAQRQAAAGQLIRDRALMERDINKENYDRLTAEAQAKAQEGLAPWQLVGGIMGGAGGLGLGVGSALLTGGATAGAIPGLMSGGAQFGAGVAGQFGSQFQPAMPSWSQFGYSRKKPSANSYYGGAF